MDAEDRCCRGSPYAVCTVQYILSALSIPSVLCVVRLLRASVTLQGKSLGDVVELDRGCRALLIDRRLLSFHSIPLPPYRNPAGPVEPATAADNGG